LLVAVTLAFGVTTGAWAQTDRAKPDLAKAQQTVNTVCAACHGADGNSPSPANPSLAGQGADYLTLQLSHFKDGVRANPIMAGMAAGLSPEDMKALGLYFSQQKPKGMTAKDRELAMLGRTPGVRCLSCADRGRHTGTLSASFWTTCRLHSRATQGFQVGRAWHGQGWKGHERPGHGAGREQDVRPGDASGRRVRRRAALASIRNRASTSR